MQTVEVVDLDADNIDEVLAVTPRDGQDRHVRSVAWYVARSAYAKLWTSVAFRTDDEVVGFAQWAFDPSDGSHCIGAVVIDGPRQGQGVGRAGMTALIEQLRGPPDCTVIALSVSEDNGAARGLYRSLGFVENGERVDDEIVMLLPAPSQPS